MCLQWATAGFGEKRHGAEKKGKYGDAVTASEGPGAAAIQSTVSEVHVVRANTEVYTFTRAPAWSCHPVDMKFFFESL